MFRSYACSAANMYNKKLKDRGRFIGFTACIFGDSVLNEVFQVI